MKFYLSFTDYKAFLKNREKPVPTWRIVLYYPFVLFFCFLLFLAIRKIVSAIVNSPSHKYPSDRYRKVIKEGVFWDTVEYHER